MEAWESRELDIYLRDMREIEKAPLAERKEACREFHEAMATNPALVAERVGWLIDGSYGRGAYMKAQQVLKSPRMNRVAWMVQTTGALEWRCPQAMVVAAWKKLSGPQKAALQAHVAKVIARETRELR